MKKILPIRLHHLVVTAVAFLLIITSPIIVMAKPAGESAQKQLENAINGSWRSEKNRARDQYRHPLQTLSFFGIKPNATIIELFPSSGWYSEILAPFVHDHGQYIAVNLVGNQEDGGQKEKFSADPAHFGKVKIIEINFNAMDFGKENSADFFLTFRNVHNLTMESMQQDFFKAVFKVLKPGGVLGIVDHRAAEGKTLEEVLHTGYLPESFVIAEAEKAGFILDGSSPINNNPKDTKDYPKNVWSLPPRLAEGDKNREKYIAIGESDRFTLRFIKPLHH